MSEMTKLMAEDEPDRDIVVEQLEHAAGEANGSTRKRKSVGGFVGEEDQLVIEGEHSGLGGKPGQVLLRSIKSGSFKRSNRFDAVSRK